MLRVLIPTAYAISALGMWISRHLNHNLGYRIWECGGGLECWAYDWGANQ